MKIYLSTSDTALKLIYQSTFHEHELVDAEKLDSADCLPQLLSSQILVVDFKDKVGHHDLGVYVGLMETLEAFKVRHSPKFLLALNLDPVSVDDEVMESAQKWGVVAYELGTSIHLIRDFIYSYPI